MTFIKELAKRIAFKYTKLGAPDYPYNIEPIQLAEIVKGIDSAFINKKYGNIVEVGVARGMTSRLIAEHIIANNYNVNFYCLDTFSSFTENDIKFEVENRGKDKRELIGFSYNDYDIWKRNFAEYSFVKPVKCDASNFDFSKIKPISFCFLDVDLYIPTKNVLNNIYNHMDANSIIIVDDVLDNNRWDGAYQAFMEFVKDKSANYEIAGNKCGIIRIP